METRHTIRLILTATFLFSASPAPATERITWQDCVDRVARQNPEIAAAREKLSSSTSKKKAAYSGFLPKLTGSGNVNRGNSYSFSQLGGVPLNTPAGDSSVSSVSLQLTQNIFAGFRDASLVEQTQANEEVSVATLDQSAVQASYDLRSAFAGLLYAQSYLDLSERIIKRREENAQLVELHFESGIENKGSVMLSKAFVGQARYDKTVARNDFDVARQQLARVMGLDDAKEFTISGGMPLSEPGPEPDLKAIAKATPVYRQSQAEEASRRAGVDLARANFYPSLDLTGTLSAQGNNGPPSTSKRSLMLGMSLPIFAGGQDYHSYKSAAAEYAAASYQRQGTDLKLLPTLKKAFRSWAESVEKVRVDKAFVEAAEVRAEIARKKYNNGLLSFDEWDIIENDLINKQKAYLVSERDRALAEAAWELAKGGGAIRWASR